MAPGSLEWLLDICRQHYIEYLVNLINQHKIDPLPVFDGSELIAQLRRMALDIPERLENESDQLFYGRCAQVFIINLSVVHLTVVIQTKHLIDVFQIPQLIRSAAQTAYCMLHFCPLLKRITIQSLRPVQQFFHEINSFFFFLLPTGDPGEDAPRLIILIIFLCFERGLHHECHFNINEKFVCVCMTHS